MLLLTGWGRGKASFLYIKWSRLRDSSLFPLIFLLQILKLQNGLLWGLGNSLFLVHSDPFLYNFHCWKMNMPSCVWIWGASLSGGLTGPLLFQAFRQDPVSAKCREQFFFFKFGFVFP